jgi:hypothetical protein
LNDEAVETRINMLKFILFCAAALVFSCSVPERYVIYKSQEQPKGPLPQYTGTGDKTRGGGIRFTGGDGSSIENAIIVTGVKNEIECIPAEIDYISKRHGERDRSWKMKAQNDFKINERIYVEYQIKDLAAGAVAAYFFDNTSLYAPFLADTGAPKTPNPPQKETRPIHQPAGETPENTETGRVTGRVRFTGGDGSSIENAIIIIGAENEKEAAQAEIAYISKKHGEKDRSWKPRLQGDFRRNGRSYVEYQIEDLAAGTKAAYFFDITTLSSALPEVSGTPPAEERPQKDTRPTPTYQPAGETLKNTGNGRVRYKGGDGTSMESAVIIVGAENEEEATQAEIDYIAGKHGGKDRFWKIILHGNYRRDLRQYNEISIKETNSGERFDYFFDVTAVGEK